MFFRNKNKKNLPSFVGTATHPPPISSHTITRLKKYLTPTGELTVTNDIIVCKSCGGNCGQCGWEDITGLSYTKVAPYVFSKSP
jgi:anaerobic ribonucleoside-triphosphate reductase